MLDLINFRLLQFLYTNVQYTHTIRLSLDLVYISQVYNMPTEPSTMAVRNSCKTIAIRN